MYLCVKRKHVHMYLRMVLDLVCFSDINKTLPGPFNDPPSKEEVEVLLKV